MAETPQPPAGRPATLTDAMPHTAEMVKRVTAIPPERFRDKVARSLLAVALGIAVIRFGHGWSRWLHDGALVLAGAVVAGEWFLLPLRAVVNVLKDLPPLISAIRRAVKGA